MHSEATLTMNTVNLKLSEFDVQPLDHLFKFVVIFGHKAHSLFFVQFFGKELFRAFVVREQHEKDAEFVAGDFYKENFVLDVVKVPV